MPPPLKSRITLISSRSWCIASSAPSGLDACSATARYWGSQAARPMPSLRIASTGASIASARTTRTPCGSCSRASDIRRPTIGTIRTSASSTSRASASSTASAVSSRARSRENSVQPSQSEGDEVRQHPRGALAGVGRHGLAASLQVGRRDPGFLDRVAGRAEGGQRAQLALALGDELGGQRQVAVEGRVGAGVARRRRRGSGRRWRPAS